LDVAKFGLYYPSERMKKAQTNQCWSLGLATQTGLEPATSGFGENDRELQEMQDFLPRQSWRFTVRVKPSGLPEKSE